MIKYRKFAAITAAAIVSVSTVSLSIGSSARADVNGTAAFHNLRLITEAGAYTINVGTDVNVYVEAWGAGGGGSPADAKPPAGGGGGAYVHCLIAPGADGNIHVVVGAGTLAAGGATSVHAGTDTSGSLRLSAGGGGLPDTEGGGSGGTGNIQGCIGGFTLPGSRGEAGGPAHEIAGGGARVRNGVLPLGVNGMGGDPIEPGKPGEIYLLW